MRWGNAYNFPRNSHEKRPLGGLGTGRRIILICILQELFVNMTWLRLGFSGGLI
jgi:hypothetical protein